MAPARNEIVCQVGFLLTPQEDSEQEAKYVEQASPGTQFRKSILVCGAIFAVVAVAIASVMLGDRVHSVHSGEAVNIDVKNVVEDARVESTNTESCDPVLAEMFEKKDGALQLSKIENYIENNIHNYGLQRTALSMIQKKFAEVQPDDTVSCDQFTSFLDANSLTSRGGPLHQFHTPLDNTLLKKGDDCGPPEPRCDAKDLCAKSVAQALVDSNAGNEDSQAITVVHWLDNARTDSQLLVDTVNFIAKVASLTSAVWLPVIGEAMSLFSAIVSWSESTSKTFICTDAANQAKCIFEAIGPYLKEFVQIEIEDETYKLMANEIASVTSLNNDSANILKFMLQDLDKMTDSSLYEEPISCTVGYLSEGDCGDVSSVMACNSSAPVGSQCFTCQERVDQIIAVSGKTNDSAQAEVAKLFPWECGPCSMPGDGTFHVLSGEFLESTATDQCTMNKDCRGLVCANSSYCELKAMSSVFKEGASYSTPCGSQYSVLKRNTTNQAWKDYLDSKTGQKNMREITKNVITLDEQMIMKLGQDTLFMPQDVSQKYKAAAYTVQYAHICFQNAVRRFILDEDRRTNAQKKDFINKVSEVTNWVKQAVSSAKQMRLNSLEMTSYDDLKLDCGSFGAPLMYEYSYVSASDSWPTCNWETQEVTECHTIAESPDDHCYKDGARDRVVDCYAQHREWVNHSQNEFWQQHLDIVESWGNLSDAVAGINFDD